MEIYDYVRFLKCIFPHKKNVNGITSIIGNSASQQP